MPSLQHHFITKATIAHTIIVLA